MQKILSFVKKKKSPRSLKRKMKIKKKKKESSQRKANPKLQLIELIEKLE